ncbi:MAG: N-acetylmuramic acid 6-phosphate etherase [Bacilli bacterium]|nr:N-acetylmuramic acid 6-phosphate etherase [Bacilli bacterium]
MAVDLNKLITESRNPDTMDIDLLPTEEILRKINNEDKAVAFAVEKAISQITVLVDKTTEIIYLGGRLIYIGAGTSGRIGILDAVECPPTFGISAETIQSVMAGGERAFIKAAEGAEDSAEAAITDLKNINLSFSDIVIGITASGRTPYAIGGVKYAKEIGCVTGSIATTANSEISQFVDYPIEVITGPEVITGSTRMKSGTAQKLICNMISTATMIKLGKVYQNLMVDVQPTNEKLISRARNILIQAAGIDREAAKKYIDKFKTVKKALFSLLSGIESIEEVESYLNQTKGNIRKALELVNSDKNS